MDRRDTAQRFRERLLEAMASARVNRSVLAARIGIDRSTLSQLLSPEADRLPRADTAAAIASALHVSLDWLLGLSQQAKLGADILLESVEVKGERGRAGRMRASPPGTPRRSATRSATCRRRCLI